MKDLRPLLLPIAVSSSDATCPPMTAVRVVTVVECKKNLHEVVPNSVFGDKAVVSLSVLDDRREVAAPTVFHEDIHDARITVDITVVVPNDVFVVQILEDVPEDSRQAFVSEDGHTFAHDDAQMRIKCAHFGDNELLVAL